MPVLGRYKMLINNGKLHTIGKCQSEALITGEDGASYPHYDKVSLNGIYEMSLLNAASHQW